jgi:Carboxypeptidase regulatory-like domain
MTAMKATTVASFPGMVDARSVSELALPPRDHMKPVALAVLVSLSIVPGLPAQNPGPTRVQPIRGRVVDVRNDVPLRRARVVLSSGGRRIDSVFTDDEGRFSIAAVPSDMSTVRASKAGFTSALVTLSPDRVDTDLRFALSRSAAVTGRVLESTGAPAVGVFVRGKLIVPTTRNSPTASTQFFTQTDRLGEYRLGNLTAGRYEITAVRIRPESARRGPAEEMAFGPPESLEVARGTTTMSLAAEDETHDVDFTISPMSSCPPGPSVRPPPGAVTTSILGRVTSATGELRRRRAAVRRHSHRRSERAIRLGLDRFVDRLRGRQGRVQNPQRATG